MFSIGEMQLRGMGSDFQADSMMCRLYTVEETKMMVPQCTATKLYFVDIVKFLNLSPSSTTPVMLQGGWRGALIKTVASPPRVRRRTKPSHDTIFRVWRVHRRMLHIPLRVLAVMHRAGMLGKLDVTVEELYMVDAHQDCYACALSKWRRLSDEPSAGPHIYYIG